MTMHFEVKNYDQTIRFDGDLLGHATTHEEGRPRWHEISIYRTAINEYVVHKVGRTTQPKEHDRHTAFVSETAKGAVDCLYTKNRGGVKFLTYVAEEALHKAGDVDPAIKQAYLVRDITPIRNGSH